MSRDNYHVALEAILSQRLSLQRAMDNKLAAAEAVSEHERDKLFVDAWEEVADSQRFLDCILQVLEGGAHNAMSKVKQPDESLEDAFIRVSSMLSLSVSRPAATDSDKYMSQEPVREADFMIELVK